MDADENAALALLREGNEMGLRWMIQRYTPYVGAIVRGVLGEKLTAQDAEEITSDVFLVLWQNRDKVRAGKVKGYLGAIARTKAIDRLRRAGGDVSLEDETLVISSDSPERAVLLRESKELLQQCLRSMKPVDREIILRYYYLCQKAPVIAQRMGMSREAVRQRLSRGREQLRRLFEEEERAQ